MVIGEDNMPGTNKTTNPGEQRKTTGMRTVAKALQILGLFNHKSPEWTIKEVSHRLDLPYSTTYRYISTLVSAGYLVSHDRNGTYRVGLIAIELGGLALNQLDVRLHGLAYLVALHILTTLRTRPSSMRIWQSFTKRTSSTSPMPSTRQCLTTIRS